MMVKTNKAVVEFVKQLHRRNEEERAFFESKRFNRLVKIIASQDEINQDDLVYGTHPVRGLSSNDFSRVCHSVYRVLSDNAREIKGNFPHSVIDYKEIEFHLLLGQGSVFYTRKK